MATQAAASGSTHAVTRHRLVKEQIGGAHQYGVATHVVNAPGEITRITTRNLPHRCAGVAPERKDQRARLGDADARRARQRFVDAALNGAGGSSYEWPAPRAVVARPP